MLKGKGILTALQENLLIDFGRIAEAGFFYLTGGTALAEFHWAHRRSYDLDFFTCEKALVLPFSMTLERELPARQYGVAVARRFESFADLEVGKGKESVRLHLACDSPFRLGEPELSEYGVKVNDYRDLLADKLLAYFGRWTHRDAIDLFFMLKTEPIDTLVAMAKQKDPGFDLYWLAVALKEVDRFPDAVAEWPVDMLVDVNATELKEKFLSLAREIMDEIRETKK